MSAFERAAIQRLVDKATAAGISAPGEVTGALDRHGHTSSTGAGLWVEANPDRESWPIEAMSCCWGSVMGGPDRCTCWSPVYDIDQAVPRPPAGPDDLAARPRMCGDCAFRKDSPERADVWGEEALMDLTHTPR